MTRRLLFSGMIGLAMISSSCDNAASKIRNGADDSASSPANSSNSVNAANQNSNQEISVNVDPNAKLPEFKFEKENHDFGTIEEGTLAKYDFEFTNTGEAPLIISNASGSCGCTVPQWPREPIAPGETGIIHVEFNSNGRPGNQAKTVTLNANTVPNKKILRINAMVNPKPKQAEEQQG
ncbi:DUF1573 domain-containing protein [Croceimicrobium hydrocarbonivorans]|uniref:DUF1573 domain-containing protein n=1 Tax=Croceimicrobium hydrocarbonivorans TaxID=2761580 RepID=A0A7H0VE48_9FLAO|nr:DUF1573 domain-containing protein [Croceimicrobium hydrocarbonivorans]QNR23996.1 DUF1573 domain-containing protein [Croceimicrobium hydrocarbonivorans]